MKAIRIDGQTPGGQRTPLVDVLPLETPYIVQIFPVYACNFKCNYCIHSVPEKDRGYITNQRMMDFEIYKKVIDDLKEFPQKIKMLRFAGTGEPLLHKDIAKMVAYAYEKQVAESIDIVTNSVLLTPGLSDELIKAGLSKLRVSIQGISSLKYKEITQRDVELQQMISNLKYFYDTKKDTSVYIKIIDCALEDSEEQIFFNMFGDVCDTIAIEHLLPAIHQIDYNKKFDEKLSKYTQNGNEILNAEICPQPFYLMQVNPEGNIVPCCAMETTTVIGNIVEQSAYDIWNGEKFNRFRRNHLSKQKAIYEVCKVCESYKYAMFNEDLLDNHANQLLELY